MAFSIFSFEGHFSSTQNSRINSYLLLDNKQVVFQNNWNMMCLKMMCHLEELFLWHSLTSASQAILPIVSRIDKLHKLSAIDQVSFSHLHHSLWVTDSIPEFLILLTVLLFLAGAAEKLENSSLSMKKQVSAINIDSSMILQVEVCHCKIMFWSTSGKNFILEKQSCTFRKLLNCLLFHTNHTHLQD